MKNNPHDMLNRIFNFQNILKYCFQIAWSSSPFYTIGRLITKLVIPIVAIINSFLAKEATNLLLQHSDNVSYLKEKLLLLALLFLISNGLSVLCSQLSTYFTTIHEDILNKDIDIKIMNISLAADLEMYDNPYYYDKLSITQRNAKSISSILWSTMDFFSQLISALISLVIISKSNALFGIVLIAGAIPAAISSRSYTKALYGLSVSQMTNERKKQYYSFISSYKEYAQMVRLYNLKDFIVNRYLKLWKSMYFVRKGLIKGKTILIGFLQFIPEFLIAAITLNVFFAIVDGKLSVGDYALYSGLLAQLLQGIMGAINNAMTIYDSKLKIETIQSFENTPKHIFNSGTKQIEAIKSIEFCNVYFRYPKSQNYVLNNLSFKIVENEKVALVGLNGSGKSTIIKLLLRFYDTTDGQVMVNDIDIKEYNINSLRKCFDAYFQNSLNFAFSIKDNIYLNTQHQKNDENIKHALCCSKAEDILKIANDGLDTYLTRMFDDNGIEISGGQHQKIALSRVFYNNRKFLLLDEPSSSLDPEAENTLFESIEKLCENSTVLFTSHRFTNLYLATKIIVLENGKVIEEGTKESLLKQHGRFYELYQLQAQKFQIEYD